MYQNGFNYYPYQNYSTFGPSANMMRGGGLGGGLSSLFKRGAGAGVTAGMGAIKPKFNWGSLLTNTQKTLGIINQAIPVFYQVKPIWNNAKTMFKIMGAMKDDDKPSQTNKQTSEQVEPNKPTNSNKQQTYQTTINKQTENNQPQFFI